MDNRLIKSGIILGIIMGITRIIAGLIIKYFNINFDYFIDFYIFIFFSLCLLYKRKSLISISKLVQFSSIIFISNVIIIEVLNFFRYNKDLNNSYLMMRVSINIFVALIFLIACIIFWFLFQRKRINKDNPNIL